MDCQHLNGIAKVNEYPLPRVDECLDLLSEQKYFSTLDLDTGCWQVKMTEELQEKMAFITCNGLFEFIVMLFGLCNNMSATFQRLNYVKIVVEFIYMTHNYWLWGNI